MKERITYIHGADDAFELSQLQVRKKSLVVKDLKAAREDRLTFELDELPQEIKLSLSQLEELHLRWSSSAYIPFASPFHSRISPGLHIFLTPTRNTRLDRFCPLLKKAFGDVLKCTSVQESFTSRNITSLERLGSDPLEYHQNLKSLAELEAYAENVLCGSRSAFCLDRLRALATATEVDIDFVNKDQKLIVRTYQRSSSSGWSKEDTLDGSLKTEIGALAPQVATEVDHLRLGGYLVVLREDQKTKPTLIQFPSRHHSLPTWKYRASFSNPSGLHPKLQIQIEASQDTLPPTANPESCSLNAYLTLPSTIFPDKYQLANELLLESLNLRNLISVSGYTDLEAPDYATSKWGSNMLLELKSLYDEDHKTSPTWIAEIPLHLRYLPPTKSSQGISQIKIPWPIVFWACPASSNLGKLNGNPFDRTNLGYDEHFGANSIFYHLQPSSLDGDLQNTLNVPVLDTSSLGKDSSYLEIGTGVAVLAGWFWIVWLLFKGWYWTDQPVRAVIQKKKI